MYFEHETYTVGQDQPTPSLLSLSTLHAAVSQIQETGDLRDLQEDVIYTCTSIFTLPLCITHI
jgi:hypothetical protein